MRQNGLKLWIIIALLFTILLGGCGLSDWTYDDFPNGYAIWRVNVNSIHLVKNSAKYSGKPIVKRYTLAFCSNDRYIGLKCVPNSSPFDLEHRFHISEADTSNPEYYLVDTTTDAVYGPYTPEEYEEQLSDLAVGVMSEWIPTVPAPDGAW